MKISKPQMKVLRLMADGWELGVSSGITSRRWLQKNGLGRGGPVEDVRQDVFFALYKKGLLKKTKHSFPSSTWGLTDDAMELLLQDA